MLNSETSLGWGKHLHGLSHCCILLSFGTPETVEPRFGRFQSTHFEAERQATEVSHPAPRPRRLWNVDRRALGGDGCLTQRLIVSRKKEEIKVLVTSYK